MNDLRFSISGIFCRIFFCVCSYDGFVVVGTEQCFCHVPSFLFGCRYSRFRTCLRHNYSYFTNIENSLSCKTIWRFSFKFSVYKVDEIGIPVGILEKWTERMRFSKTWSSMKSIRLCVVNAFLDGPHLFIPLRAPFTLGDNIAKFLCDYDCCQGNRPAGLKTVFWYARN